MIEIDYKRIPQWLQERNKLSQEWSKKYKALQLKQLEILGESKSAYTFQDCFEELDKLKNSDEGTQKTIFGGFSSKSIKTMENLLKLYQKENLHLVNMGQALVQLLTYDIPGIKKQLILNDQQLQSTEQRIIDSQVQIQNHKQQFEKQCKKYGINGQNIEEEVPNMILQIPQLFQDIEQLALKNQTILDSIEYYRQFSIYTNASLDKSNIVIHLESFVLKGNQKPVDWDIIEAPKSEEIDWMKYIQPQQVSIPDSELLNTQFRSNLIINLNELIGFYQARLDQQKQDQSIVNFDSQNKLFELSQQQLLNYLTVLHQLLEKLMNPWLRQLLLLKSSVKTQQRIIKNLEEFAISIKKSESNIIHSQNKIIDLKSEQFKLQNQLRDLQSQVKKMKQFTEKQFTDLFKTEIKLIGCDC
ncbi:unnamed protein product [Paramecium sonneborni]|uniref:Uncharacterized protein n=1 Tax=Paramecium sonneborni TaxID=65129 RepID=A0A8S1L7A1_9CILI|nr:unnamed protein product [Paramecium sonneborni]